MKDKILNENQLYLQEWKKYNPQFIDQLFIEGDDLICKIDNKVEKEDVHDFYFPNILYNALLRESLGSQELSAYDLFWIIRISHQTEKMKMKRQQKLSTYPKISQVFIQKDQEKPFLVIIDELGHKYRYDTMYPEKVLQIYGLLKAEQKDVTLEDLGKEINHVR